MGLWQRTATNVGWIALAQFFTVGVNQLVLLALASILTPLDFGVYAACTVVNVVLIQLTSLGLDYAVINSRDEWKKVISSATIVRFVLSVVSLGLIVVLSGTLSDLFQIDNLELPMILASSAVVVIALAFPPSMELTKNLRFKRLSICRISGSATWSVLALTLALLDWSYWSLIVALVSSQLATLISAFLLSPERPAAEYDRVIAKKLIRFGGVAVSGTFLGLLAISIDKFVVGAIVGPASLGVYWAMFTYGTASPQWISGIVNTVMFPTYTILRKKPEAMRKAYSETLRYVSEFSAPISMGLAGGSSLFVMVLLGGKWESGIASLSLLSVSGFFMSMASPAANVFVSMGRPDLIFRTNLQFLVPMALLLVPAAHAYEILGVSAVILGHESTKCVYVIHLAGKLTGAKASSIAKSIMPSVSAAVAAGLVVLAVNLLVQTSVLGLALAIILGVLTYFLLGQLLSRGAMLRDFREGVRAIRGE